MISPTFKVSPERKLIGKRIRTSLSEKKTAGLWRGFMPRRKEIGNALNADLFSIEVYAPSLRIEDFNAVTVFDKWAAIEVADHDSIPGEMEAITIPGGLYAVFIYKGAASEFAGTFEYIFDTWLPASGYALDSRPHFEIMGEKYKHEDPASEEEIWIPVKMKV